MTSLAFGALCFSSLFTVIDPIAAAPVFASIARGRTPKQVRRLALRACVVAFFVLVLFAVSGALLFRIFGITIDAFRIGGGLVFLMLGLPMLSGHHEERRSEPGEDSENQSDPSVVPLGMPLLGGPGAITTVMVLMGQSQSVAQKSAVIIALALALILTLVVLVVSPILTQKLGNSGLAIITKLMGLIIVVIGVQFVVDGVRPIAVEILRNGTCGAGQPG